jgi:serine/threonine-protein kinase ATR
MVGDWNDVENIVSTTQGQASQVMLARLLLAVRGQDSAAMREELKRARLHLGARLSRLGVDGHRQTYDSLVDLHLVAEVEKIHSTDISDDLTSAVPLLSSELASRLDLTLPTFNIRERILGMRRTAYQLRSVQVSTSSLSSGTDGYLQRC